MEYKKYVNNFDEEIPLVKYLKVFKVTTYKTDKRGGKY